MVAPQPERKGVEGLRVFVVEDESLVAMQLEDMLGDLGCEVADAAMRLGEALNKLISGLDVDVAILDVNIGGEKVYPLAEALRERSIPFVFATGYGRDGVLDDWRSAPIVQKPYSSRQIEESLIAAVGGSSVDGPDVGGAALGGWSENKL